MRTARRSLLATVLAAPLAARALAQPVMAQAPWPQRGITLVVPYPPGGSSDNTARPLSQKLAEVLGVNIIIENRGGAGGSIGAMQVAQARPDGHTLLCFPTAILTISPHLMRLPYNVERDFTPVAMVSVSDGVMALHPAQPFRSVQALVTYAKANPGKLRFSSAGNGTITQMIGEIFAHTAGIELQHIPYRGSAPALTALLAGEVELQFDPIPIPAVKEGRLIGLAGIGEDRCLELPTLPTLRELGLFGAGGTSFFGLAAPAGLPDAITARLVDALRLALAAPEVARAMAPVGLRPKLEHGAAFAARLTQDRAIFGEAVRRTGARVE